ncbi:Hypothetical protein Bdt_1784 [Bdellovibrio bacteriovorus str. Tiberius]|uniref:Uncharacterized protein n=1 Tax=Bdellovibrio bacteriovorus str. Tiberius TaxID=1069642 RepID=K7YV01_BDEBC|nr:Hypothetical protein Bdt_1784 [Bdellovibrio bacteriovorus str. Tiberius]
MGNLKSSIGPGRKLCVIVVFMSFDPSFNLILAFTTPATTP